MMASQLSSIATMDDVVNLLFFQKVFLVIGEDFELQPFQALRSPAPRDRAIAQTFSSSSLRQRWQIACTIAVLEGKKR